METKRQEAVCSECGTLWDPDACPACDGYAEEPEPRNVIFYRDFCGWEAEKAWCWSCETKVRWQSEDSVCPLCGSEDLAPEYPEIPDLNDEPGVALMLHAEGRIPRDERGAILARDMLAWLRLHGVRKRTEQLEWEEWFVIIGGIRAGIEAEMR